MVEGQQQVGVCFVLLEDSQEVQPLLAFLTAAVMLSVQELSAEMRMTRNQKLWTLSTKGGGGQVSAVPSEDENDLFGFLGVHILMEGEI